MPVPIRLTPDIPRLTPPPERLDALAELAVGLGANVQAGQVVSIRVQPGQEPIVRAVAEKAYARGASYVDLRLFDPHVKHARLLHTQRETLSYTPPWIGESTLALADAGAARISFQGPVEPHLMDDVDPEMLGLDTSPRSKESTQVTMSQKCNWTIVPFPNPEWAALVHPDLPLADAYAKLWDQISDICRLGEPDPTAAWVSRLSRLEEHSRQLNELALDRLHFVGPGTDLIIGLLPSSQWISGRMRTVNGVTHCANIPTEEVFTAPDPQRVDGHVRATKPLLIPGAATIEGLSVHFEAGRAVALEATQGADILRTLIARDEGACRLGEVALVDRESRIGRSGSVFYSTLLDENSASHIAVGAAYPFSVGDEADRRRANTSSIHIDFMIGSNEVRVDGVRNDGTVVPLLLDGAWQI